MDQQNKTKPEENQNKSVVSDKDLEQVSGGIGTNYVQYQSGSMVKSPRDSASGQATGFTAAEPKTLACELMFDC